MNPNTEPNRGRAVRIRAYLGEPRDVRRTFLVPADADLGAFMKRAALAVLPKDEGWLLVVFSVERTSEGEQVAPSSTGWRAVTCASKTLPLRWRRRSTGHEPCWR